MKKFSVKIECGNAAFGDTVEECGAELARLLQKVAGRIEDGEALHNTQGPIMDLNGNRVGQWFFEGSEEFGSDDVCDGCGRDSADCSADPCADVIADREE